MNNQPNFQSIKKQAMQNGLVIRGGFKVEAKDLVPELENGAQAVSMILFGNAGSSLWPVFSISEEYEDGLSDPLDRWSKRIGEQLAADSGGMALFPFGGPPFQPFLRWAKKAEQLDSSRLGMLMHPNYGLWHAYRFAVAFSYEVSGLDVAGDTNAIACDTCTDQPCLSGCPVRAFTSDGYDVESCFHFLDQHPDAPCHSSGCQARCACPEGVSFRYDSDHAAFHMAKFYESLATRFKG